METDEYASEVVSSSSSATPLPPDFSPYAISQTQPAASISDYGFHNEDTSHYCPTFDDIFNVVLGECNITRAKATTIAETLATQFQSIRLPILDFRAWSTVEFFTNEDSCPLLEWQEGNDHHVMVLIKVFESDMPCTWLSHTFALKADDSWVSWQTTDVHHLKDLFCAAQHLLHLFRWPMDDLLRLCSEKEEPGGYEVAPSSIPIRWF